MSSRESVVCVSIGVPAIVHDFQQSLLPSGCFLMDLLSFIEYSIII